MNTMIGKWTLFFGFLCVTLLCLSGSAQKKHEMPPIQLATVPLIGDPIVAPRKADQTQCMVNSAQLDPCVEATIDGIKYAIAFRKSNDRDYSVTRVYTGDAKFKSPEGLRVGDEIMVNGPEEIFQAPYFEVYAKRGTQWIPVVGFLGKANVAVGGKGGEMKDVQTLWPNGPAPVRLWVGGFIEREGRN